jgi:glutamyl-tRNA reductase
VTKAPSPSVIFKEKDMAYISNLIISEFAPGSDSHLTSPLCGDVFEIRTCQRTLFLSSREIAAASTTHALQNSRRAFSGSDAYEFLLRFAAGLESEIKGETDVFGQVKTAFKSLSSPDSKISFELADFLQVIFQKLLEDTKEIRAQYLQGIGGNTYGALARRLLAPTDQDKVLILGAGQIAKSVSPYFTDSSLKIWNRSSERLMDLMATFANRGQHNISAITTDEELVHELESCTILILATPPLPEFLCHTEMQLVKKIANRHGLKILHLGGQAQEVAPLLEHFTDSTLGTSTFFTLSDLFGIEREQSIFREKQVAQALEACSHRAKLRGLAKSISISHGWEDLALFY